MNIEAFNTDTLRKLVRNLQDENKKLKEKLDEANIPYEEINLLNNQSINQQNMIQTKVAALFIQSISQKMW